MRSILPMSRRALASVFKNHLTLDTIPRFRMRTWGRSNVSPQKLTVSKLARIAGVGPDSIRHYERIGLVPKAERSSAGYRLWAAREVQYLKWVAPAKRAGFTLHELAEIFRMYRAGSAPCRTVQGLLRQKLADLDRKVDELSALRTQLSGVLVRWEGRLRRASGDFVPLFDDLHDVPVTQPTTALARKRRNGEKP